MTIDIQHQARSFPRIVALESIDLLVARALAVVSAARHGASSLPADARKIATSALDKVTLGLNAVGDHADALLRRGASPHAPAPPALMSELRRWTIQAAIESNAIAAGNDRVVEAQRQFFSDLADEAQKVGAWVLQAPGKALNLMISPITEPVKWLLVFGGIAFGLYLWTRWREQE